MSKSIDEGLVSWYIKVMENERIFTGRYNNRKGHKYYLKKRLKPADYQLSGAKQKAADISKEPAFKPSKNSPEFTR